MTPTHKKRLWLICAAIALMASAIHIMVLALNLTAYPLHSLLLAVAGVACFFVYLVMADHVSGKIERITKQELPK